MPRPDRGALRQVKPKGPDLVFEINPESVVPSGGFGGWERIGRPRRRTALEWAGSSERSITFMLILDGWPDRSVENDVKVLEDMALPVAPRTPPPELEFDYGRMGGRSRWVIDDLSFGEELRDAQLRRVRQEVTVTLIELVEGEISLSPVERHKNNRGNGSGNNDDDKKGGTKLYVVRSGDTLSRIASRLLGKASEWPRIARLNDIRDPNRLTVGQKLRIPKA